MAGVVTAGEGRAPVRTALASNDDRPADPPRCCALDVRGETLHEALDKMLHNDIGRLPVVSREEGNRLVGYLGRARLLEGRMRRLEEESVREPGWIARRRRVMAGS